MYNLGYSLFSFWSLFDLFARGRLYVIFIFDDSCVGVAPHNSWVVHEIGAIEPAFFSVFGFDGCDFRFGCEVELSGSMFHNYYNIQKSITFIHNHLLLIM